MHPLQQQFELMRRVIVDVKNTDEVDRACGGIKLHINPRIRKMPLQYLSVHIDITAIEERYESLIRESIGESPV
jgi:hypothetical protein